MIRVDTLHVIKGHGEKNFDDVDPEDRAKLAIFVNELLKKGTPVIINFPDKTAALVKGYDPETNMWLIKDGTDLQKIDAKDTAVVASPKTSGG